MRKGPGGASIKLALLLPLVAGAAAPAPVPDSRPPTVSVMTNGLTSGYAVRFGGPVDHAFSRLLIVQDGRVLQTLAARLDSAPNVLFARGRALPPGTYELHWTAKSMTDGNTSEGDSTFSIEPLPQ
jgi:methionine-rich copper-binding protein CopC